MAIRRAAGMADVAVVRGVTVEAYQHYVPRIGMKPAPMLADFAKLVEAEQVWVDVAGEPDAGEPVAGEWVAGGAVAGEALAGQEAIVGLIVLVPGVDHLLVENVAVRPSAQGTGVGLRLMAFAEEEALRRGLAAVTLYTHELMTENLAFYARRGYRETHRAGQDGYQRVFLRKRLGQTP